MPSDCHPPIPAVLPVMTLAETVLFPGVVLPLHIFEPRYRTMLGDVLRVSRIFAVASMDRTSATEEPCSVATAGIVRSCLANDDGTANLILQGVRRVALLEKVSEAPYPVMSTRPLLSVPGGDDRSLQSMKRKLLAAIKLKSKLGIPLSPDLLASLEALQEPEITVDTIAYSLCSDPVLRQILLETLDTRRRGERLLDRLRRDIADLRLEKKLQGGLCDEDIENN